MNEMSEMSEMNVTKLANKAVELVKLVPDMGDLTTASRSFVVGNFDFYLGVRHLNDYRMWIDVCAIETVDDNFVSKHEFIGEVVSNVELFETLMQVFNYALYRHIVDKGLTNLKFGQMVNTLWSDDGEIWQVSEADGDNLTLVHYGRPNIHITALELFLNYQPHDMSNPL